MAFEPDDFGMQIFRSRHAAHENETWAEGCERVAAHVSNAEEGEARGQWRSRFYQMMLENLFMPGGRIWYGSGRARGQLLNCFVIETEDSREGWGKSVSDSIVISGTGGGVGINCSPIRPKGMPVRGTGGTATGAVSLMEIINAAGDVIKAGGGRRTALMLCLNIDHGDIVEFMDKKLDLGKLNNANVSVVFDDDPEKFFSAVKADADWPLMFNGRQVGNVKAKELWDRIVTNALKNGEPGLLNMYLANRLSNVWYWKKLTSTNPCGEVPLHGNSCCCLGSLVLPRFVKNGAVDWDLLGETVASGVRFLDDVLTVNYYPLPEISEVCNSERRIGLGITGLHDMLLELGMKYSSSKALEFTDKLIKFIKDRSYEASVELAKEKGAFVVLDVDKYLKSGFAKTLRPSLRDAIKEHGIRNCALNTIAPTGTISIVCGVSSGIEPIFSAAYERRFRDGDEIKMEVVVHPLFKRFVMDGRSTKHFQGAYDLSLRDHFEMQRVCQKHIDLAISKTLSVPPGTSHEELSELYMEFLPELKGVTVYPVGSRENQPLTPLPLDVAEQHAFDAISAAAGNDACRDGSCDV